MISPRSSKDRFTEIWYGFVIIGLAFTLPIAFLFYFIVNSKSDSRNLVREKLHATEILDEKIIATEGQFLEIKNFSEGRAQFFSIGQEAGLDVDSKPDSFYMSMLTVAMTPRILESLVELQRPFKNWNDRQRALGLLTDEARRTGVLLRSVVDENKKLYGEGNSFQKNIRIEEAKLNTMLKRIVQRNGNVQSADIQELFRFWHFTNDQAKEMYVQQLMAIRIQLWSIICTTLAAWLACVIFTFFFSQRLLRRQKKLEQENRQQSLSLMAAAKMSALGEMAGNIAHEINSPLAAIRLNAEILQQLLKEDAVSRERSITMTENLIRMVDKISQIMTSMLNFARNSETDSFVRVKIARLFDEVLLICQEKLKRKSIVLQVEVSKDLEVDCRPGEISQVILNLMKNAIDAIENLPEKWIHLCAHQEHNHVLIEVTDSGRGISKSVRERIFEPYFSTKPLGHGTGLGLGISKRLIEAHHGQLRVDDHCENTRFVIEL